MTAVSWEGLGQAGTGDQALSGGHICTGQVMLWAWESHKSNL